MSYLLTKSTTYIQSSFSQCSEAILQKALQSYRWCGRRIEIFCTDTIPSLYETVSDLCLDILRTSFWLMPYTAFLCGHYKDAAICGFVAGVSLIDIVIHDKEFREASSIIVGAPLALNVVMRLMQYASNYSRFHLVSIAFHLVCMAKLALIARGQNY